MVTLAGYRYLSGVQVFFSRYLSVTWTGLPSRKLVVSPVRVRKEDER